ncbi:MAG: hypothetical protein FJX51_05330, partial [Alphaproteobacteria bacterium]|nr:hypothetical protein [Alphaproteobacteria bacterium]
MATAGWRGLRVILALLFIVSGFVHLGQVPGTWAPTGPEYVAAAHDAAGACQDERGVGGRHCQAASVRAVLDAAFARAVAIVTRNRDLLVEAVEALLKRETFGPNEIDVLRG